MKKLIVAGLLAVIPALSMAATNLTVQTGSKAGVTPTRMFISSTETWKFRNNGKTILLFEKTGAGNATVTITTPGSVGGLAIADQTVEVVASSGDKAVGPLPASLFNDSNGNVSFTLVNDTGITVALISL